MCRITINKVNKRISQYAFELVRGKGYYYFSRMSTSSPNIYEDGIYGTPLLSVWTIDQLEKILVERILDGAEIDNTNLFVTRAREYAAHHVMIV